MIAAPFAKWAMTNSETESHCIRLNLVEMVKLVVVETVLDDKLAVVVAAAADRFDFDTVAQTVVVDDTVALYVVVNVAILAVIVGS